MSYTRIRYMLLVPCGNCGGSGVLLVKTGEYKKCLDCKRGDVEKWVVEIKHDESEDSNDD